MKNTFTKIMTSALALALVATSATVAKAPAKDIKKEETKAPAIVETVETKEEAKGGLGIVAAVEAKAMEEAKIVYAEEAAAPEVKIVKAEAKEEIAAPAEEAIEVKEEIAAPAEEIAAPAEAEEIEAEAVPAKVWNISATEEDNVAMEFYAEPEAGPIPVDINKETGKVVISGEGAMEDAVYRHFMTTEKYLTAIKALYEKYYDTELEFVYDENITDVIELDYTMEVYDVATGEQVGVTEEMRQDLDPAQFLAYSPKTIEVGEGITNVSRYAFACCKELETVELPSTIEVIEAGAFEYCKSLKTIVVPANVEVESVAFGYCTGLESIFVATYDYYEAKESGVATVSDFDDLGWTIEGDDLAELIYNY